MGQRKIALSLAKLSEKWQDALCRLKTNHMLTKWKWRAKDGIRQTKQWLSTYKRQLTGFIGAAAIAVCVAYTGNAYVEANMNEIYKVYVDDELIGEVSSPDIVKWAMVEELEQKSKLYPGVEWELKSDNVRIEKEIVFKGEANDRETTEALLSALEPKAVGVEIVVDGKAVAVVKDEETAQRVLDKVKAAFERAEYPDGLMLLSADPPQQRDDNVLSEGKPELISSRIVEPVELQRKEIAPNDIVDEQAVIDMLLQGDTKPTKYIVQAGDTPIGIAKKLDIPLELLYLKNQDHRDLIERDLIRVGDELDLTMQQPGVTVETVEKVSETIEMQYDIIYEEDETLRKGQTRTVREGEKGIKQVTYLLTKVNGLLMQEEAIDEVILKEPVPAIVRRGTKIVKGEGTGKFAWPVVSPTVTSNFGKRWGRQHKGIDITSKNKSVLAADSGVVSYAGYKKDYGNHIIIDHRNGYKTLYAHLSKMEVKKGDIVEKGDKIGVMGSTGRSTGVHLHFEIIVNGVPKNPRSYLSSK